MTGRAQRAIMIAAVIAAIAALALAIWLAIPRGPLPPARDGAIRIVASKEPAGRSADSPTGTTSVDGLATPVAKARDTDADMVSALMADGGENPYTLERRLRAEPRDPAWAPATEVASRAAFAGLPYVGTAGNPLAARCGTSLCEIGGRLPAGLGPASLTLAMDGLQGRELNARLARAGLDVRSVSVESSPDGPAFVVHARRR